MKHTYSVELIKEMHRLYPGRTDMHKCAEDGNYFLGRYLCDSIPNGVDFQTIMAANSLKELQALAAIGAAKSRLYQQWNKEVGNR
jgi:hypothetical protein